jgi:hypothetical protein
MSTALKPVESGKSPTALADALEKAAERLWTKEQAAVSARFKVVKRKYRKRKRK